MPAETQRQSWPFVPFVSVGPLRFGMSRDQVVDHAAATLDAVPSAERVGDWVMFSLPTSFSRPLTTYFSVSGGLACVAIDARHGPQITLGHLRLVGQVPSQLEDEFSDYMSVQGLGAAIRYSQYGDLGTDAFGVVLRAQRVGDIVLSRPVFVAQEWADMVWDASEGTIPEEEWRVYC
ncbi:hypothetical protein ACKI1Q_43175 [Streptomyces galilaeus]|uniref:hypothetical protein n=1 Tax=Streptomyces galilaeus TaxID=33899 RepID=UPI0038F77713